VVRAVWPTQIFLDDEAMRERSVSVADVARFVGDYRLIDNTRRPDFVIAGAGRFGAQDRLFEMSAPAGALRTERC